MSTTKQKKTRKITFRDNPYVEEFRKIREEHAAKFNYDPQAICDDIVKDREQLKREGWTLVSKLSEKQSE